MIGLFSTIFPSYFAFPSSSSFTGSTFRLSHYFHNVGKHLTKAHEYNTHAQELRQPYNAKFPCTADVGCWGFWYLLLFSLPSIRCHKMRCGVEVVGFRFRYMLPPSMFRLCLVNLNIFIIKTKRHGCWFLTQCARFILYALHWGWNWLITKRKTCWSNRAKTNNNNNNSNSHFVTIVHCFIFQA